MTTYSEGYEAAQKTEQVLRVRLITTVKDRILLIGRDDF
jgi:hypothetical protein